jgi:peptide/nickel transport system permease protein
MVAEGRDYLLQQWWVATFPGLALFLVVVGFNLFGEIIRDWLDPSGINR